MIFLPTLRVCLLCTVSLPSGLGLASWFLASIHYGQDAKELFRWGVVFLGIAVISGSVAWLRTNREERRYEDDIHHLEDEVTHLAHKIGDLAVDQTDIRHDVNARLAAREWRRACEDTSRIRRLHLLRPEEN